ncbi:MAG: cytochrome c-type biogenesis CcmF C-terminal domain-containing protein [Armatimonadota bacterium]|nr:cytochrome c-type biogenesis CcmF C-terminal domain-containing protein [Armatimonadota bacterium]MDR7518062.1 cytochrome c-type biogenesis CcmF C-terminal domain-containing protein [Armatimonadota bacterium]MDR7550481.1 cytochrome c-type biogenesis CcmF C-terminal domain-containing protein [Armatimonadota bacterium]
MGEVGRFALQAGVVVAAYGLVVTVLGIRWHHGGFLEAGRRAAVIWALLMALAAAALFAAFLSRDFSVRFVAAASESTQSLFYTVTAFWGGHDGALLLWALVLAGYLVAGIRSLRHHPDFQAPAAATLLLIATFFSLLLATASNPFAPMIPPPPDGQGLNPLLRNPWMAAHPPTLYLGFVGMSMPFAVAVAALVTGRLDDTWIVLARRWVVVAWLFLTLGLLFGAKWSYVVLGWGGYWAWDPVENAAFMPWLTATAFLHSIQIQERRGMLATWNVALILITFGLTIFGTFLVRSGVLSSIHAFAQSPIGYFFLGFLAVLLVGSFALLAWRWDALHSRGTVESVVSRETAFLANNLLFVAAAVVVFVGTIFPALTEAFRGVKINVGPTYFNMVMFPIAVGILLLMGVGPLLPWRRATPEQLSRNFMLPGAAALLAALMLALFGVRSSGALLVFALAAFVFGTIVLEAARGTAVRMRRGEGPAVALARLVARNRRRYGGYTVHLGILLMLVGIAGSSAFATQGQAMLRPGERFSVAGYTLEYGGLRHFEQPGIDITEASVRAWAGSKPLGVLRPQRLFYRTAEQPMHHVAIRSSVREDLYVILSEWTPDGRALIRVLVHPLVSWLWAGGAVIALGVILAVLPETWRRLHPTAAPARRRPLPVPAGDFGGAS